MPEFDPRDYLKIKPEEAIEIAIKNGFVARVIQTNGITDIIMYDFIENRINLRVSNGMVIGVYLD